LRGIVFHFQPSFSQPSRSSALLRLGSAAQGAMPSRASARSNQGPIVAMSAPCTPKACDQCASVCSGVRRLVVQLTVVVPPTARPWKIATAPSDVLRPPPS